MKRAYLIHGCSGSGKTILANAISKDHADLYQNTKVADIKNMIESGTNCFICNEGVNMEQVASQLRKARFLVISVKTEGVLK